MPLYGPPCLPLSGGTMKGNILSDTDGGRTIGATGANRFNIVAYSISDGVSLAAGELRWGGNTAGSMGMQSGYLTLGSTVLFRWSSGNPFSVGCDVGLYRDGVGLLTCMDGATAGTYATFRAKTLQSAPSSANGQSLGVTCLTELTTIAAAATTDTVIQIPANAIVLGVSVRNTVAVTCTSTYTVGDSGNATRYSTAAVSKVVNSTDPGTKAGAYYNTSAVSVRITPDTTPSDATGRVRVTVHYIAVTAPTS